MQQASNQAKPSFKRPLFTKPSWAQEDKSINATDFFRRSNQSYVNIAAEAERRRQKRFARKERERARSVVQQEPAGKRQRISSDSDSENDSDHSSSNDEVQPQREEKQRATAALGLGVSEEKRTVDRAEPRSSPKSLSERYGLEIAANKRRISPKPSPCNIIDLEDEDEPREEEQEQEMVDVVAVKQSNPPPEDDDFPPSDDEFADLARRARETARTKRLELNVLNPTPNPPSSGMPNGGFSQAKTVHASTPPTAAPDPIVSILITSRIPNTNPLIVNRKISQRLKDVRVTWCQRQSFTPDFTASVFMTWRGKRLFDVTTCRSLGIGVDCNGNIVTKGQKDILGEEERQIHMEAMTEGIIEEIERMKRREASGEGHGDIGMREEMPPAAEKQETPVRIILKAKGYSDFKLIVKSTTSMSRIVSAFRTDKNIDSDREVFLSFDGDRLAPECQVGETELAEMDYVDVYVK
ncbi:MAG: hypothetical protein LQ344_007024 [Seirophora lacunosa]|nr:MAG: hypothetical protein LQ344_007024 [Seirophora lacunosa]